MQNKFAKPAGKTFVALVLFVFPWKLCPGTRWKAGGDMCPEPSPLMASFCSSASRRPAHNPLATEPLPRRHFFHSLSRAQVPFRLCFLAVSSSPGPPVPVCPCHRRGSPSVPPAPHMAPAALPHRRGGGFGRVYSHKPRPPSNPLKPSFLPHPNPTPIPMQRF